MYERVSDRDFRDVWKTLKEVDARFWHAVKGWEAVPRTSCNNYRSALVYRGPDDTLYFVCRALYVIPESEYRFIEGDVNVMIAKDLEVYEAYVDAKVESFANDMDPSEVEGVPKFETRIDSYPIRPYVNDVMVKHYNERHGITPRKAIPKPKTEPKPKAGPKPKAKRGRPKKEPEKAKWSPHKKRERMYDPTNKPVSQMARRRRRNKAEREAKASQASSFDAVFAAMRSHECDFTLVAQPYQMCLAF